MTTSDQFNLNIRQATPQDNELLAEIGAETFYDSFAPDNTPGNMAAYLAASFSPQQQAAELADPNSSFLIAEIGDEVVGYARLKFADPPQALAGQKTVEIARFYARKRWIGLSIKPRGRLILDDGAKAAVERAMSELQQMRREAASSIVIPEGMPSGLAGGAPGGGKIKLP